MAKREAISSQAAGIVVKIGSAVFMDAQGRVDRPAFAGLVSSLDALVRRGWEVTVVSSGAVAMGRQWLGQKMDSEGIPEKQALAALGQSRLMQMYEAEFWHYERKIAQVLFTRGDLSSRKRYLNARRTLERIHRFGAIPVINENDTVATEELRFGDNDELAGMTAGVVGAELVVLLSDVEGLFEVEKSDDGQRRYGALVSEIAVDDERIDRWAGPSDSDVGTGGMISKVEAARLAARFGASTVIAPGKKGHVLEAIVEGEEVGSWLRPGGTSPVEGKKVWLGAGAVARGVVRCDEGAVRAIWERGASLLPSGIVAVEGEFGEGEVVELVGPNQEVIGRGLAVYDAKAMAAIAGQHSDEIEATLGYKLLDAAVHRDNLVVIS